MITLVVFQTAQQLRFLADQLRFPFSFHFGQPPLSKLSQGSRTGQNIRHASDASRWRSRLSSIAMRSCDENRCGLDHVRGSRQAAIFVEMQSGRGWQGQQPDGGSNNNKVGNDSGDVESSTADVKGASRRVR
jgi:hypothetical protein